MTGIDDSQRQLYYRGGAVIFNREDVLLDIEELEEKARPGMRDLLYALTGGGVPCFIVSTENDKHKVRRFVFVNKLPLTVLNGTEIVAQLDGVDQLIDDYVYCLYVGAEETGSIAAAQTGAAFLPASIEEDPRALYARIITALKTHITR